MIFQTPPKDQNNRYKNSPKGLQNEICTIWLGLVNLFQTFEDLEFVKGKQAVVQEIRQLVDENEPV